jgi:hypothetical protein
MKSYIYQIKKPNREYHQYTRPDGGKIPKVKDKAYYIQTEIKFKKKAQAIMTTTFNTK